MPFHRVSRVTVSRLLPVFVRAKRPPEKKSPVVISLRSGKALTKVAPEYLSFSIDISVLAGGFWWEGSEGVRKGLGTLRVPPLKLDSSRLDALVQALGPAYLRVGGSEADKIHYFENTNGDKDALVLTQKGWDELHAFVQRNHLRFMFTFKYGLFSRSEHGRWQGTEIQKLLQYSRKQNYVIDVCELGNELNAYWAFHGLSSQPRAAKLAQDYATFAQLIRAYYPKALLCGPGSAFWPLLGETIRPFSNITQKFLQNLRVQLDIVDWHYYPFQSRRSPVRTRTASAEAMIAPSSWSTYSKYCEQLKLWRDRYQPEAELWTGETGSAQCGGQAKISDRFVSCFWWADQLGRGALHGQKVLIRQSLLGGEYGMIDRLTLKPRPDYWLSWLWCQLMGEAVYGVQSSDASVLVYCHSHPKEGRKTLLIINTSVKDKRINIAGLGASKKRYCMQAKKLQSKKITINGVRPHFKSGGVALSDFPKLSREPVVPALSINFWCFSH